VPDGGVERVFIHFPDPWWKRRHAKRMVLRDTLLDQIARLLVAGGELYLQTDVEVRAFEYLDLVRAHAAFTLEGATGLVAENPYLARSNREVRADQDGLPVYRILARRISY
jgi:tRNA (guanine-N7-)-methyltransferase